MGTEIQAKAYFSRSYSMMDLNECAGSSIWSLYHEHKTLKNDQFYNSFLTRPAIDGYFGYDKEQIRQTFLKHESIFRHQLEELHRLYRRQRDLMNEIKRRELQQHLMPAEMSQSSLFLSHIPSEDIKKTCHVFGLPIMDPTFGRPTTSVNDCIQSPLSFMKGMDRFSSFLSQDRVKSKDCKSSESKCNMFRERLLNLELPASVCTSNEGKWLEESACGVPRMESCPLSGNWELTCERDVNLSLGSGLSFGCNGDSYKSNLYSRRTQDMIDLNEPFQVEGASVSASVDNLGNVICLDEEIRRRVVSLNSKSGFHISSKESSQSSVAEKDGGICLNNMHSENDGIHTELSTYKNQAGQSRCNTDSLSGGVSPENSPAPFKSINIEPEKLDEPSSFFPYDKSKQELGRKRKTFGVEISEGNHDQSVEASHAPNPCPLNPQFEVAKSESSSLLPWSQDVLSVRENSCISTSFPFNRSSSSLMPSLEFVEGKMQFSNNSKLVSRTEVSYQQGVCLGSQSDGKKLQVCCSSIGYDFLNGINGNSSMRDQCIPQGSIKYDKLMEGLPPLKEKELARIEPIKGREDSHQMNSHSLQNYPQLFANRTEMEEGPSQTLVWDSTSSISACDAELEKIEVGASPSNSKILGFPIFVHQIPKDVTSLSSPSKSSCLDSDGGNEGKGLDHTPRSRGQLEVKDLVTEKGLGNYISGLKHHIDLNLCMNEDEVPPIPSLPRAVLKIATTEIDLEALAVLESESEVGPSPEADSLENQLNTNSSSKFPLDESKEHSEELVRVAAEAIIAISSCDLTEDITCHSLRFLSGDSLHWFAEVVSSYNGDLEGELKADNDSVPDGMDYFEFMTLKLTETKLEEHYIKSPALQNQRDDEEAAAVFSKRPRRGQARRGRQRMDFQRDVLPGLVSLTRHEVTEDLQAIGELFKAASFAWQPSLTHRNSGKKGRGRRRPGGSAPSLTPTAVCPSPVEQYTCGELVLEGETLTGWGKRTRRLPRQRCSISVRGRVGCHGFVG